MADTRQPAVLQLKEADGSLCLTLAGDWLLDSPLPDREPLLHRLGEPGTLRSITYDSASLGEWDTGLITFLAAVHRLADTNSLENRTEGLPEGARGLLDLAFAVKEREGARREKQKTSIFQSVGNSTLDLWQSALELVTFFGELTLSIARAVKGQAMYQKSQIWLAIQESGAEALPIVSLISFLIGMIFAFVGVVQLSAFGAGIFTADLVAVAMVREMAPIMTAILMAGRTGASYAAQIGTMKVNEEVDALTTLGINPIDFLVLPRVLALTVMMPFLTMYSSLLGIIGGGAVALSMLDVTTIQYVIQTNGALTMNALLGGLFKSVIYGLLVALAGTQQGMACGNSAMAVGQATTKAVVMGIVLIVVSASLLTIIYINLGI